MKKVLMISVASVLSFCAFAQKNHPMPHNGQYQHSQVIQHNSIASNYPVNHGKIVSYTAHHAPKGLGNEHGRIVSNVAHSHYLSSSESYTAKAYRRHQYTKHREHHKKH